MSKRATTTRAEDVSWLHRNDQSAESVDATLLVIIWSAVEPNRLGEVAIIEDDGPPLVLGRGRALDDVHEERLRF